MLTRIVTGAEWIDLQAAVDPAAPIEPDADGDENELQDAPDEEAGDQRRVELPDLPDDAASLHHARIQ